MGLLFLTPHEGRVVVSGWDADPTWRPFPSRAVEDALDAAADADEFEWSFQAAVADRTRRQPPFLELNANSKYWKVSTRIRVLLLSRAADREWEIVGVGNCATEKRRGWMGTSRIRLSDWRLFAKVIRYSDLVKELSPTTRNKVEELFNDEDSRSMPKVTSGEVWAAVRKLAPDSGQLLQTLPPFPPLRRLAESELTVTDAAISTLRFFTSDWRKLEPVPNPPPPPELALRLESLAVREEDEVITDDTGAFLDWESDGRSSAGWYQFRSPDDDRELWVKNINFKSAETKTGADLVYVRTNPESVVLVQYKLLTSDKNSNEYFFRDSGGRLLKQVKKMLTFSTPPTSDANGPDDYRIGGDIGFVKFVIPTKLVRSGDRQVLPDGRYHPAEGVLRMLNQPAKGTRRGPVHRVQNWRSLDGETFAKLVRDQWIGSVGEVSSNLLETLNLGINPLYLAVEERVEA